MLVLLGVDENAGRRGMVTLSFFAASGMRRSRWGR